MTKSKLMLLGVVVVLLSSCSKPPMQHDEILSYVMEDSEPRMFIGEDRSAIESELCNDAFGFTWEGDRDVARKEYWEKNDQAYFAFYFDGDKVSSSSINMRAESHDNRSNLNQLYPKVIEQLKGSSNCKYDYEGGDTDRRTTYFYYLEDLRLVVTLADYGESTSLSIETEKDYSK